MENRPYSTPRWISASASAFNSNRIYETLILIGNFTSFTNHRLIPNLKLFLEWRRYSDGSTQDDVYDVEYDGGYRLLPMELAVGDTFTTGGKRRFLVDGEVFLEDEKSKDWEVLEESSVTVPGGTFATLRATDGEGIVHIAQDVGFVRWEEFSWLISVEGL